MDIVEKILSEKIIAIMRRVPVSRVVDTAEALYEGGLRVIEFTFDQSSETGERDAAKAIAMLRNRFDGRMETGAGTVLTKRQVDIAIDAGAGFIVSPNVNPDVIRYTVSKGAVSIPGGMTPSEIIAAHEAGAALVKLFPAGELGAGYVKAVVSPVSHVPIIAVGGVDLSNIAEFIEAGIRGFGVGSSLVRSDLIEAGHYGAIKSLAEKYTALVKQRPDSGEAALL